MKWLGNQSPQRLLGLINSGLSFSVCVVLHLYLRPNRESIHAEGGHHIVYHLFKVLFDGQRQKGVSVKQCENQCVHASEFSQVCSCGVSVCGFYWPNVGKTIQKLFHRGLPSKEQTFHFGS